jgi:predicted CXXCH cytochrome family protein
MTARPLNHFYLFLLLTGLCALGFLSVPVSISAQGPTPTGTVTPTPGLVQKCADCHLDVVAQWQNSPHAKAYSDPIFQGVWQDTKNPQCLGCHTTGFVGQTGEYAQQGVTCEACHGQTPAKHPPEALTVKTGVEVCADCHTTTVAEWKRSAHGTQQLACTTCHQPHPQKLRFETADALCLNCHKEARTDFAHTQHTKQTCIDCHWYRSADEAKHILTGNLLPTGHDNQVETRTCVDCHARQVTASATASATAEATAEAPGSLLEVQMRAGELEAQVRTVQAQGDNMALVRMLEGAALGAVLGGGLMATLLRLGRRAHQSHQPEAGSGENTHD